MDAVFSMVMWRTKTTIKWHAIRLKQIDIITFKRNLVMIFSGNPGYIQKGKSYILHGGVIEGEVCHFIKEADPPYKSNLIADGYCLSFLSSNEKMKEFSDAIGGEQSQVPGEAIDTFTDRIVDRIIRYQVPRITNCISGLPGLMHDVMKYPDEYSYPLIAFVYAAMKQGLSLNAPLVQEALQRRSMRGNKNFDNDFSQKWLVK